MSESSAGIHGDDTINRSPYPFHMHISLFVSLSFPHSLSTIAPCTWTRWWWWCVVLSAAYSVKEYSATRMTLLFYENLSFAQNASCVRRVRVVFHFSASISSSFGCASHFRALHQHHRYMHAWDEREFHIQDTFSLFSIRQHLFSIFVCDSVPTNACTGFDFFSLARAFSLCHLIYFIQFSFTCNFG